MKILIVVDMQNDFIDGALGTSEAVSILPKVIDKIKNFKGAVFATRDTHDENYLKTQEGANLPVPHCIIGTKGHEIHEDIMKLISTTPFDKVTFGSTDLAEYLKNVRLNIEEIELVGLCTDICVISNALLIKATLPEVKISVCSELCAGVTPLSHQNALEAMKMCQINII